MSVSDFEVLRSGMYIFWQKILVFRYFVKSLVTLLSLDRSESSLLEFISYIIILRCFASEAHAQAFMTLETRRCGDALLTAASKVMSLTLMRSPTLKSLLAHRPLIELASTSHKFIFSGLLNAPPCRFPNQGASTSLHMCGGHIEVTRV